MLVLNCDCCDLKCWAVIRGVGPFVLRTFPPRVGDTGRWNNIGEFFYIPAPPALITVVACWLRTQKNIQVTDAIKAVATIPNRIPSI